MHGNWGDKTMKARIIAAAKCGVFAVGVSVTPGVFADVGGGVSSAQFNYEAGSVWVEAAPFDQGRHQLSECASAWTCTIDGMPFFGTDGDLPSSELKALDVVLGDKRVALDVSGMFNPWIDQPAKQQFSLTQYAGGMWELRGQFSDGAAAYKGQWLITNTGAVRTLLGPSELVCDVCLRGRIEPDDRNLLGGAAGDG